MHTRKWGNSCLKIAAGSLCCGVMISSVENNSFVERVDGSQRVEEDDVILWSKLTDGRDPV